MNKYEIMYPAASRMIEQERLSVSERESWERVPAAAYKRGADGRSMVAVEVANRIERELWLEEFAQASVDRLRAIVHVMGNVPEWQVAILEETIRQVREGRPMRLTATRSEHDFYGLEKPETFKLYPNLRAISTTARKVA